MNTSAHTVTFDNNSLRQSIPLSFNPLDEGGLSLISRLVQQSGCRTCDFTLGGLFLWREVFNYQADVLSDTLFIKGVSEDDTSLTAFSMPVGRLPLHRAVNRLASYCTLRQIPLRFSAVPESRVKDFETIGGVVTGELTQWADYLYDARALATLAGHKYNKKRNHVNRFMAENKGWRMESLSNVPIDRLMDFMRLVAPGANRPAMAHIEHQQVIRFIKNYPLFAPYFEGRVLIDANDRILAVTVGEVVGDTLHVHIEKARHDINGVGETVNMLFARDMLMTNPNLAFINRQDDSGDEMLRRAKLSYHPVDLLRKFNIEFPL